MMSPDRLPEVMSNLATAARAARSARRHAGDAERGRPGRASPVVAGIAGGVRRREGRAAAGDRAGARRPGVGSPRHHLQHDRARRGSQAARPDADAQHAERDRLRQGRASSRRSGPRWRNCWSPTTTSRSSPRRTAPRSTASAGAPSAWRRSTCRRSCPSGWTASARRTSARLSVTLLIDLFTLEQDAARAGEMAPDLSALAEDLLMSGAYDDALTVTRALQARAGDAEGDRARRLPAVALDQLGESLAMRETVGAHRRRRRGGLERACKAVIDDDRRVRASRRSSRSSLVEHGHRDAPGRAESVIVGFGDKAVPRLASLVGDSRWFVQRRGARLLGADRRRPTPCRCCSRCCGRATRAWRARPSPRSAGFDDPAAARAIHTVLRAATGDVRRAVIEALVAERDPRVVPMLVRDPRGERAARQGSRRRARDASRRSARVGTDAVGADAGRPSAQRQEVLRRQEAARAQGAERRRARAHRQADKAAAALDDAAEHRRPAAEEDRREARGADGAEEGRRARPAAGRGAARHGAVLADAPARPARHRRADAPPRIEAAAERAVDRHRLHRRRGRRRRHAPAARHGVARRLRPRPARARDREDHADPRADARRGPRPRRGAHRPHVAGAAARPADRARRPPRHARPHRRRGDVSDDQAGHRGGAARLRHGRRDGRERCGTRPRPATSPTPARRARSSTAWRAW